MRREPLDIVVEQAKQYFVANMYDRAIETINNHESQLPELSKDLCYDIKGCSLFMLEKYGDADEFFNKAILENDSNLDYYISKAACQRKIGNSIETREILDNVKGKVTYPSLYYNYCQLTRELPAENLIYNGLLESNRKINPDYLKYKGLEPTFLKQSKDRINQILRNDKEIEKQMGVDVSKMNSSELSDYFTTVKGLVRARTTTINHIGVLPNPKLVSLIHSIKQVVAAYDKYCIMEKEAINLLVRQRQQVMSYLQKLLIFILTKDKEGDAVEEEIKRQITNINDLVNILEAKQVHPYSQIQSYKERQKTISKEFPSYEMISGSIKMKMTDKDIYAHISSNFRRSLTPKKLINALKSQDTQVKRFFLNLYWLIVLKSVFNSSEKLDFDWQLFTIFKQIFRYLYIEIVTKEFSFLDLEPSVEFIMSKWEQFMATGFLNDQKMTQINNNYGKICYDLDSIDEQFSKYCSDNDNIKLLFSKASEKQAKFFREKLQIGNTLRQRIAEAFIVFSYHLRNKNPSHKIVREALNDIASEGKETFNGKRSMMLNFQKHFNPPTFYEKIVQMFTD